jgi:hypothetical protein
LEARSRFEKLCESKFGFKVFSYRIDDYEVIGKLVRTVNWNEQGVIYIIHYLTKFCIEAINNDTMRSEIRKLDRNSKTNDMEGLKLLEKWLELSTQNLNAPDIMKPFFVLYDFRLYLDHYMSHSTAKKTINSCYKRLGINRKDRKSEKLYDKIVERIT